jgi:dihydroorotate dehydrogenase electron transfer subunit
METQRQPPVPTRSLVCTRAPVLEQQPLAPNIYRLRLHAPELAACIRPGQFLMLRWPGSADPLLGRPYALYDTVLDSTGQPLGVDIVYLVVGKLTRLLATLHPGERLDLWGPLGQGFPDLTGTAHVGLVAGGIGQTPFLAYLRELLGQRGYAGQSSRRQVQRVSFYYGARRAERLAGVEDFRQSGAVVHLATEDGSCGFPGRVTDLVAQQLRQPDPPQHLIGCGPEPMLRALAHLARQYRLPCHVSLETPMACGLGICFACVTRVHTPTGTDYRRVCVEGPVFDAATLVWDEP